MEDAEGSHHPLVAGVPVRITDLLCDRVKATLRRHWTAEKGDIYFEVFWEPRHEGLGILLVIPAPDGSGYLLAWPRIPAGALPTEAAMDKKVREGLEVLDAQAAEVRAGRSRPSTEGFYI